MSLRVDLDHRFGDFDLDVRFESAGRLTALFGPSGSGKTSLVDLVAGLMRPDRGRIVVDDRVLVDTEAGIFLPKHRRRIGYVFQDARLFPHMSVAQNLRYGRWFTPTAGRYQSFDAVVDLLGIAHLLERRPAKLSGGERQRVAIGRALLASPRLLLMDEPLAALDEARKAELLPYIERLRDEAGVPILYVSHSVPEVLRLASHLVVLDGGKVVATGDAPAIMQRLDLVSGESVHEAGSSLDTVIDGHDEPYGLTRLSSMAGIVRVPRISAAPGTPVRLRIRARDVMLSTARPDHLSALNVFDGVVTSMVPSSESSVDVGLDCSGAGIVARLTRLSAERLEIAPGRRVHAVVKSVSFERGVAPSGHFRSDA